MNGARGYCAKLTVGARGRGRRHSWMGSGGIDKCIPPLTDIDIDRKLHPGRAVDADADVHGRGREEVALIAGLIDLQRPRCSRELSPSPRGEALQIAFWPVCVEHPPAVVPQRCVVRRERRAGIRRRGCDERPWIRRQRRQKVEARFRFTFSTVRGAREGGGENEGVRTSRRCLYASQNKRRPPVRRQPKLRFANAPSKRVNVRQRCELGC